MFKTVFKKNISNKQIFLLKWVFKYKFNSNGYLKRFKAQLYICRDLQVTKEKTYVVILAA